jgi:hypothetical protein
MLFFAISVLKYRTHQSSCSFSSYINHLICLLINEIRAWTREIAISNLPRHEHMDQLSIAFSSLVT